MAPTVEVPVPANPGAEGIPYYTPAQLPPPGTALQPSSATPTLFTPLKLRSMTLPHRIVVSPMCMYSAEDGHLTDFHLAHHGQFAIHGAGLTIIEATAVQPNGRITPQDSGLWQDSQIAPIRRITDLVHGLGQHVGIQLAHAGRKASTVTPWATIPQLPGTWDNSNPTVMRASAVAGNGADGGWPDNVVAPSKLTFGEGFAEPRELSVDEIQQLVRDFAAAAKRAVEAGVDTIEIHAAHGYLITEFLSPITNKRTDAYGGSFENRTRILLETIAAVRAVIPATMPLWVRVSATEWAPSTTGASWTVDDTIALAKLLPELGVDVLDVSSGGNIADQDIPKTDRTYQTQIAGRVRRALSGTGLKIAAVGFVDNAATARELVQGDEADADLVLAARQFLREPEWVLRAAHQLGVEAKWANQYHRAVWRKGKDIR